jgi:hypothetical protein
MPAELGKPNNVFGYYEVLTEPKASTNSGGTGKSNYLFGGFWILKEPKVLTRYRRSLDV